jgi:hypothetical protein
LPARSNSWQLDWRSSSVIEVLAADCEIEQARSAGHAFLLGDGDEDLQLTESKSHIDITDNPYLNNPVNRYCRCL